MYSFSLQLCLLLALLCPAVTAHAQVSIPDTLFCGDTLIAEFTPGQIGPAMDSFYVWLGNCDTLVRFDFTTANVPDAADIYYVDLDGNMTNAGKIPYFGAACGTQNYFGDPSLYPLQMSNDPQYCLPGFLEMYGGGVPFQDSILQRFALPPDFLLSGYYQESARLHLRIPPDIVAVMFVIRYNPGQSTVLSALWDCSPTCCIEAVGDTVCVGESIHLNTDREALAYEWTGPNGFVSQDRNPVIPFATASATGWYVVNGSYLFDCTGTDSVYVEVRGPEVSILTDTTEICLGSTTNLQASGAITYNWIQTSPGFQTANGATATVAPMETTRYTVVGEDGSGCRDTASAVVVPVEVALSLTASDPSCLGEQDGLILGEIGGGIGPFEIRRFGTNWQAGTALSQLPAGTYSIEVRDSRGCRATAPVTLTDPPALSATVATGDPTCQGDCDGEALIESFGGTGAYRYRFGGGEVGAEISDLCAGGYEVTVVDANGCTVQMEFVIEDPAPFTIDLGKDKKVREGDSLKLVIMSESLVDLVSWPGYCDIGCEPRLMIGPDSAETITAIAWTAEGCMAIDSVQVRVKKKAECVEGIYVPTAFSPNGDGYNEWFTVYSDIGNTDVAEVGRLVIYNRWGKMVFDRSNFAPNSEKLGWDGFSKGSPVPEGVYAWAGTFIREDGLSFKCGGSITLIR